MRKREREMVDNSNLHSAKREKQDEFYTQYEDIETEMNAYFEYDQNVFKDKTILLPCDDPEWSEFTRYFASNFDRFGIKKLISTSYAPGAANKKPTLFELSSPTYNKNLNETHGKLFVLERERERSVDIDDLKFTYLKGDGDFRSPEVCKLRDESDIIITNPPFSLFREFLNWILTANKKFIILGNVNAITYKEIFPLLKRNKIWIGYRSLNKDMFFRVPEDYGEYLLKNKKEGSAYKVIDGIIMGSLRNACWFTNIDLSKRHKTLQLDTKAHNLKFNKKLQKKLKEYGTKDYPKYDNYDAIEVPFVECIPSDYKGVMGVPITFMDKYNPEQFEIVSFRKGEDGKDLVFTEEREREREFNHTFASLCDGNSRTIQQSKGYKNKWKIYLRQNHNPKKTPVDVIFPLSTNLQNGLINNCAINGKKTYVRMLIQSRERK